ncbi:MAG: tetratricopeptide repeat protein [bacterium]|nr:tetratricopeptide repeat protein [bacterium]
MLIVLALVIGIILLYYILVLYHRWTRWPERRIRKHKEEAKEALEACKEEIRLKPSNADAHYNLGRMCLEIGNRTLPSEIDPVLGYSGVRLYEEAVTAFKEAIRLKPDFAKAHLNLGVAYGSLSRYEEAIAAYKEAIRLKPDYAGAHYNLGLAYLLIGNLEAALEQHEILKILDADFAKELSDRINDN